MPEEPQQPRTAISFHVRFRPITLPVPVTFVTEVEFQIWVKRPGWEHIHTANTGHTATQTPNVLKAGEVMDGFDYVGADGIPRPGTTVFRFSKEGYRPGAAQATDYSASKGDDGKWHYFYNLCCIIRGNNE